MSSERCVLKDLAAHNLLQITTHASLTAAREEKESFTREPLHQTSCQNFILLPLPACKGALFTYKKENKSRLWDSFSSSSTMGK